MHSAAFPRFFRQILILVVFLLAALATYSFFSNANACAPENFSSQKIILEGHSMEPAFPDGSVLSLLLNYYHSCPFVRGDVVGIAFDTYAGHKQFVKRIIAIPGDRVSFSPENKIILNDTQLVEPYAQGSLSSEDVNRLQMVLSFYQYAIPPQQVLVLGDNRSTSFDSRAFGLVHVNSISGKVLFPAE